MYTVPDSADFMASSQVAAIQPVVNGVSGPQLVRDYSFPLPTYKTAYPIVLSSGPQEVVVRFLARQTSGVQVAIKNCNVTAFASPQLEYVQNEVYQVTLTATPQGTGLGSTQIEITELGRPVCYVIVQFNAQADVGASLTHSTGLYSPMQASMYGSQWRQSQSYNIASPNQQQLPEAGSSFNRTLAYPQKQSKAAFSPNRYHSQYCYGAQPIPEDVAEQARLSNLAFSQSGSKVAAQAQEPYDIEKNLNSTTQEQSEKPKAQHENVGEQDQAIPKPEEQQDGAKQGSANEEEEVEKEEVNFQQDQQLKPSDLVKEVTEKPEPVAVKQQADSPFRLVPSALLLPPASRGQPQAAIIRIKNTEQQEIVLKLVVAPRSFNTSTANCEFQQLAPGCAAFNVRDSQITIAPGEFKDVEVLFEPLHSEYILHAAKLLITVAGRSYQVPVLGLAGIPDISAHGSSDSREIRLRNDGNGVGVVTGASESWILQPGASQVIQSGEKKFKVMHDGLRMLREPEWKEMIQVMGMTGIDEQIDRLIAVTCIEIQVEE